MRLINHTNGAQRLKEINAVEKRQADSGKNRGFLQLRRSAIGPFRDLMRRSNVAARVLLCLAEDMYANNRIDYSTPALWLQAKASRSTVYVALKLLQHERWIERVEDDGGYYRVSAHVFWSASNLFRDRSFRRS